MWGESENTRASFGGSDLALERARVDAGIDGVEYRKSAAGKLIWERIRIHSEAGARSIGRPEGHYDTLSMPRADKLDEEGISDAAEEIAKELCRLAELNGIVPERLLVVGLGNANLTPDKVGPLAAGGVRATKHLEELGTDLFSELDCSLISVISPGVKSESGLEAFDTVTGVCDRILPDAVIAIDALATRSVDRLGSTVQLCDTGIFPGSGIGSTSVPLNKKTLGVPVIAIGVPTVIDAETFISEALADGRFPSLCKQKNNDEGAMFVSPREIDDIVKNSARVISEGINQAFGILL